MNEYSILNEITEAFVNNVQTKNLLKDEKVYERFSQLFSSQPVPTSEQLKKALFEDEELP